MGFGEFVSRYGLKLNNAQCEAAQAIEGATLLLAVPGSGKTTVLVTRLGYMVIELGIAPSSILTMTYTVAATKDMKDRFCSFFGEQWRGAVEFRTINGVCAKIIRAYERMTGRRAFELVSDEKESTALLSAVSREFLAAYPSEADLRTIRTQITYAKNMLLSDEQIKELDKESHYPIHDIFRAYNAAMREQRRMDYDDQLVYAYRILRKYPRVLEAAQNAYRYICVDEAQDTSRIQYEIINLLSQKHGNLFMVGDEDQSIYGFRAAYPEALLNFESLHPGARVLLMEENFRSDAHIVEAADRFIQKNPHRHEKHMYAHRPAETPVKEILLTSRSAQYAYLLKTAINCKRETAVLYRENESALPLIDLLERGGVPYRIRMPDLTFFTHRVVQDVEAIIRFAYDPYDTDAFMQMHYKISAFLSRPHARMICEISKTQGISVFDALDVAEGIPEATLKSCRAMQTQLWKLTADRGDRAIERICGPLGYEAYLDYCALKKSKLPILQGIGRNEPSAMHLLKRLDELSALIRKGGGDSNAQFILSTVHSSKGLEYDTVYLMDVVDYVLPETAIGNPSTASPEEYRAYEEDRRLFYVAATRAKNRLNVLTYAGESSCFCDEFLEKKLELPEKRDRKLPAENFDTFRERYGEGARMVHKKFGEGIVVKKEEWSVTVRFADGKIRKFSLEALYDKMLTE